jgi:predicted Zn-dependent protease
MDAVKWAWEEGQKSQNYAIEERESIRETTQKQPEEIVVKDSLHATIRMAAKLRNSSPEILSSLTTDNFFTFLRNSY